MLPLLSQVAPVVFASRVTDTAEGKPLVGREQDTTAVTTEPTAPQQQHTRQGGSVHPITLRLLWEI